MQTPEDLTSQASWFTEAGPDYDVVVSTRVRLARNLSGYPFPGYLEEPAETELVGRVLESFDEVMPRRNHLLIDPRDLSSGERLLLMERNLAGGHVDDESKTAIIVRTDERFAATVNVVDHIRLCALRGGRQIRECHEELVRIDKALEKLVEYATSIDLGYLTSEISNVGTGMRASVLLHLPALVETDSAPEVFDTVARAGFMVKGFWISDDKSQMRRSLGNLYQVANLITIGVSEDEIVEKLEKVTAQLVHYEQKARRALAKGNGRRQAERIRTSAGTLEGASTLTYRSAVELLSDLRLGVALGVIPHMRFETVTALFFVTQKSHIIHSANMAEGGNERRNTRRVGEPTPEKIDELRADLLRRHLYPAVVDQ